MTTPAELPMHENGNFDPDAMRLLDEELAAFTASHGFLPKVTEALAPANIPLYTVGLPAEDERYEQEECEARRLAIRRLNEGWSCTFDPQAYAGINRRESLRDRPDITQENIENMRIYARNGLRFAPTMPYILARLQFLYAAESPPVWDVEELIITELPPQDLEELYAGPPPDGLTFFELSEDMRALQPPDLSKELLDRRFENFADLAQLGIVSIICEDLARYGLALNHPIRKMVQQTEKYRADMLSDDLPRKQGVLNGLADFYRAEAGRLNSGSRTRAMVGLLGARSRALSVSVDEYLQFFANVYTNLGYELPPLLRPPVEEPVAAEPEPPARVSQPAGAVAVTAMVEAPTIEEAPTRPFLDEAEQAELEARSDAIAQEMQKRLGGWQLSNTQRERQALSPLASLLAAGLEVPDESGVGTWRLDPLPMTYACAVADTIGQLHRLTQRYDAPAARQAVADALETRRELAAAWETLRDEAWERGAVAITKPSIPNLAEFMQRVANQWHVYRAAIEQTWPNYDEETRSALGDIWQLLPPPEPGSPYATLLEDYERRYKLEFGDR
jgi:hypothetical protein